MHRILKELLDRKISRDDRVVNSRDIVDIMNIIGKCVVSGNIRRVAEIAIGEADDHDFINLKNYHMFPERMQYGWVSNNSIFAKLGMDYQEI